MFIIIKNKKNNRNLEIELLLQWAAKKSEKTGENVFSKIPVKTLVFREILVKKAIAFKNVFSKILVEKERKSGKKCFFKIPVKTLVFREILVKKAIILLHENRKICIIFLKMFFLKSLLNFLFLAKSLLKI